jgi:hypothetical protein
VAGAGAGASSVAFLLGLAAALATGVALLQALFLADVIVPTREAAEALALWTAENLGWSAPLFAMLSAVYCVTLAVLGRRLARGAPAEHVAQLDHLAELWINLFFGIGVIWTAIGMRGALLYALGDPESLARDGAFTVLERMVDGGILLALSTTILGGAGGYLLRTLKAAALGGALRDCYAAAARHEGRAIVRSLRDIETRLDAHAVRPAGASPGTKTGTKTGATAGATAVPGGDAGHVT